MENLNISSFTFYVVNCTVPGNRCVSRANLIMTKRLDNRLHPLFVSR